MKHEIKLAMALSSDDDLTEHFRDNYTTEELADLLLEKRAFPGQQVLQQGINRMAPYLKRGVDVARNATLRQAAGVGAAGGALLGAGRHLLSGRDKQTGLKHTTLLGSMAGGAVAGTGIGLGVRAGANAFHGTGLHKRMVSGDFKFAPPGAKQKPLVQTGTSVAPPTPSPGSGGTSMI